MKLPTLILCLITFSAVGQQIKINNFQVAQNGTVNVDFTINPSHSDREVYDVLFYSSIDNFNRPIAYKVENVKTGVSRNTSFSGSEQFGGFTGQFQLKLVAQASTFPIRITPIDKGLKIGKTNNISWMDYHDSGPYDVSLYQGQQLKSKLATGLTSTRYSGQIPKSLEKGDYSILITPSDNDLLSDRYPVTLKKAISPLVFVGAAALAGGGAFLAGSGGGDPVTPGGGGPTADGLPDPPGPPGGN